MRRANWAMALVAVVGLLACNDSDDVASGNTGSETHWLVLCEDTSECGEGQCVCGVCTRSCASDSSCAGMDPDGDVECRATEAEPRCEDDAPEMVCLAADGDGAQSEGARSEDSATDGSMSSNNADSGSDGSSAGDDGSLEDDSGGGNDAAIDLDTGSDASTSSGSDASTDSSAGSDDSGGPGSGEPTSFDFPTLPEPDPQFCSVVASAAEGLCPDGVDCPFVAAASVTGIVRGMDAGLDGRAHAALTSDNQLCFLAVTPDAEATTTLNPLTPVEELADYRYPMAVDAEGSRHIFASGETEVTHLWERSGSWNSEPVTLPDHLEFIPRGATFDGSDGNLQLVYSAHLPNPGSTFNHTLVAASSVATGDWQQERIFEGLDQFELDGVVFPVGASSPSVYWFAEDEARELFAWQAGGQPTRLAEMELLNGLSPRPVGRLSTGEALLTNVVSSQYPIGPLEIQLVRDGQLMPVVNAPGTVGQGPSGCPVPPGSFAFGMSACGANTGPCTETRDVVGNASWTETEDDTTWIAYVTEHWEDDYVLVDECFEAEIDAGCTCNQDPSVPRVQRIERTLRLARVRNTGDTLNIDVVLRMGGVPSSSMFVDARGSMVHLAFQNHLLLIDTDAL